MRGVAANNPCQRQQRCVYCKRYLAMIAPIHSRTLSITALLASTLIALPEAAAASSEPSPQTATAASSPSDSADKIIVPESGKPAPAMAGLPATRPIVGVATPEKAKQHALKAHKEIPPFGSCDSSPDAHPEQYKQFVSVLEEISKNNEINFFPAVSIVLETTGDELAAMSWMKKAADAGNPAARYFLASITLSGSKDKEETARAYEIMRQAADKGYTPAIISVSVALSRGRGVEKNQKESVRYLTKAAADDDFRIRFQWLVATGRLRSFADAQRPEVKSEVERGNHLVAFALGAYATTPKERIEWYGKAADLGSDLAMLELSNMFIAQGIQGGAPLLDNACKLGNRDALHIKINCLLSPEDTPEIHTLGFKHNEKDGADLLRLNAMSGHAESILLLANCYLKGKFGFEENVEHGYKILEYGCLYGSPPIILQRACCMLTGTGTKQDIKGAHKIFDEYVRAGHPLGLIMKAYACYKGLGAKQSISEIEDYCYQAAAMNYPEAYIHLACIYAKGLPGQKGDPAKAEDCLLMCGSGSSQLARKLFENMTRGDEWDPYAL